MAQDNDMPTGFAGRSKHCPDGRIKKGKSGNPRGRPKRKRRELVQALEREHLEMEAAIFCELDREVTVKLAAGGQGEKMRARDVIARAIVAKAMKGDRQATLLLHKFTGQTAKALKASNPPRSQVDSPMIDGSKEQLIDFMQNVLGIDLTGEFGSDTR